MALLGRGYGGYKQKKRYGSYHFAEKTGQFIKQSMGCSERWEEVVVSMLGWNDQRVLA